MIGEKRFIWGLNLWRILESSISVISSDTKQLRTYSTITNPKNDSKISAICEIFQGVGVSGWKLVTHIITFLTLKDKAQTLGVLLEYGKILL
jgi:hypothetical protein